MEPEYGDRARLDGFVHKPPPTNVSTSRPGRPGPVTAGRMARPLGPESLPRVSLRQSSEEYGSKYLRGPGSPGTKLPSASPARSSEGSALGPVQVFSRMGASFFRSSISWLAAVSDPSNVARKARRHERPRARFRRSAYAVARWRLLCLRHVLWLAAVVEQVLEAIQERRDPEANGDEPQDHRHGPEEESGRIPLALDHGHNEAVLQ